MIVWQSLPYRVPASTLGDLERVTLELLSRRWSAPPKFGALCEQDSLDFLHKIKFRQTSMRPGTSGTTVFRILTPPYVSSYQTSPILIPPFSSLQSIDSRATTCSPCFCGRRQFLRLFVVCITGRCVRYVLESTEFLPRKSILRHLQGRGYVPGLDNSPGYVPKLSVGVLIASIDMSDCCPTRCGSRRDRMFTPCVARSEKIRLAIASRGESWNRGTQYNKRMHFSCATDLATTAGCVTTERRDLLPRRSLLPLPKNLQPAVRSLVWIRDTR
jgi:hypothetical protein